MNRNVERLYNGIIKENPTFVLMLGMCPTLAVTSSAINGLGMGLSTTVVLVMSNLLISAFRKVIPNGVRMPAYIVIVASLVTVVQFIMQAYTPSLSESLGVYIPLIVVNCIILGRAESYASKNPVIPSAFDGLGMGLGFTIGLVCIGFIRQILGATLGITIFIMAPGAFLVLAFLVAGMNCVREAMEKKGKPLAAPSGCLTGDCKGCDHLSMCTGKLPEETAVGAAIVNNVVLSQFLGICAFLGVSKKTETAAGMGGAVIFVITLSSFVTGLIYKYILTPLNVQYLQTIVFILVIAALVQLVEMFLKKSIPSLYQALGVYLPLITTNCAVLGVALNNVTKSYTILQGVVNGLATSIGFFIAIVIMAGIREKIEYNDIPKRFQGTAIVLITAALMSIAFMGFSGMI